MVVAGHGQHHHYHTVLRQQLAVVQHHRAHFAHCAAIHEHLACRHGVFALHVLGGQLNHAAILRHADVVGLHAHLLRQTLMDLQHALFTVEGDKEAGTGQRVDDLQLLLAGVTRHVEHIRLVVDHVHPLAEQLVDDAAHLHLVAGDGAGGDDDLIARSNVHLPMGGEGHAVQGAHLLTL